MAAEAKAALVAAQKAESERAAAEKLRDADRKNKDLAEVSNHLCPLCSHASHVALPEGSEKVRATAVVWHHAA